MHTQVTMFKHGLSAFSTVLILSAAIMCSSCGSAGFYHDAAALEFENIDYGFPTTSAEINGTLLSWHDSGGNGVPVVLIHGLASNAGFWRLNVPSLTQSGLRVIAVDLPGYGKSGKSYSAPYSLPWYAQTLEHLLDHLKIDRAVFAGHSMGAHIALTLALESPSRVRRLVLLSPAGIEAFNTGEGRWLMNSVTPQFVTSTPPDRIRTNLVSNFFNWSDNLEWMVEERVRMSKAREFDRFAYAVSRSVAAMVEAPVWQRLGEVRVPVLIIAGENDNLIPNPYLHGGSTRDVMEWGASQFPDAQLRMVACAGHMIQLEKPDMVNEAIATFATAK